jgi:hypothetical protein
MAIVSRRDIVEAMQKLENNRRETGEGHDIGHVDESTPNSSAPIIIN